MTRVHQEKHDLLTLIESELFYYRKGRLFGKALVARDTYIYLSVRRQMDYGVLAIQIFSYIVTSWKNRIHGIAMKALNMIVFHEILGHHFPIPVTVVDQRLGTSHLGELVMLKQLRQTC